MLNYNYSGPELITFKQISVPEPSTIKTIDHTLLILNFQLPNPTFKSLNFYIPINILNAEFEISLTTMSECLLETVVNFEFAVSFTLINFLNFSNGSPEWPFKQRYNLGSLII